MTLPFWMRNKKPAWVDENPSIPIKLAQEGLQRELPEIREVFGEDGLLVRAGMKHRRQQFRLANATMHALRGRRRMIGQALTGTGKSLAYATPALIYSSERQVRGCIATSLKMLQDQLAEKDLPFLLGVLEPWFASRNLSVPRFAVLMGKDNYKCQSRKCGGCGDRCYGNAWRAAESAHVVVLNHALLALDRQRSFLPHFDFVIVDEAHKWEHNLRSSLTRFIHGERVVEIVKKAGANLTQHDLSRLRPLHSAFFKALHANVLAQQDNRSKRLARVNFTPDLEPHGTALAKELGELSDYFDNLEKANAYTDFLSNLCSDLASDIESLFQGDVIMLPYRPETDGPAMWGIETRIADLAPLKLHTRPSAWVFTSATLATTTDPRTKFDYFRQTLGLEACDEVDVGSPFEYSKKQLYYVTETALPQRPKGTTFNRANDAAEFARTYVREYHELLEVSQGRALCLFHSYEYMHAMRRAIGKLPYPVRWHEHGDAEAVEWFQAQRNGVLFSVTLWEGIDVPGPQLSMVIIDKLPLLPPDDPVFQERCRLLGGPSAGFQQVSLPQATIIANQGAGRVIRSETDRGLVAIMDNRLLTDAKFAGVLQQFPGKPGGGAGCSLLVGRKDFPTVRRFLDWPNSKQSQGVA